MKKFLLIFLSIFSFALPSLASDEIFQYSKVSDFNKGAYDGTYTLGSLRYKGDFGIGFFDRLDGQMVYLNNVFYRIKDNGRVSLPQDTATVPFATVKFFKGQKRYVIQNVNSLNELTAILDKDVDIPDIFYAFRINAEFAYVKTKNVGLQPKPYQNIANVEMPMFEFENVKGTIVGFKFPSYMKNVVTPGYHFYFITRSRKSGGQLLDAKITYAKVETDKSNQLSLFEPSPSTIAAQLKKANPKTKLIMDKISSFSNDDPKEVNEAKKFVVKDNSLVAPPQMMPQEIKPLKEVIIVKKQPAQKVVPVSNKTEKTVPAVAAPCPASSIEGNEGKMVCPVPVFEQPKTDSSKQETVIKKDLEKVEKKIENSKVPMSDDINPDDAADID